MPAAPMEENVTNSIPEMTESPDKHNYDTGHVSDLSSLGSSRSGKNSSASGHHVPEQGVETFIHGRVHRRSSLDATRNLTVLPEIVPEVSFEVPNHVDWHEKYIELEVKFTALSMHAESVSQELDEAMEYLVEQNERVSDLKEERLDIRHDLDVAKRQRDRLDHENKILRKRQAKTNQENERLQKEMQMLRALYGSDAEDSDSESGEMVRQGVAKPSRLEKFLTKNKSDEDMMDVNMNEHENEEGDDEEEDHAKDDASVKSFHSRFSFLSRKSKKSATSLRKLDKDANCSDDNSDTARRGSYPDAVLQSSLTDLSNSNKDNFVEAEPLKGIDSGMSQSAHVRGAPTFRRRMDSLSASEHVSSRTLKMDRNLSASEHIRGRSTKQCPVDTLEEYTRTNSMIKWFGSKMGLDSELGDETEKLKDIVKSQRNFLAGDSMHTENADLIGEESSSESSVKST